MSVIVEVQCASAQGGIPSPDFFERWIDAALHEAAADAEVSVRIVDEPEARELNERYRAVAKATNVLSFPAQLPSGVPVSLLGDLVLCAPVVESEAVEQGKPLEAHWAHLVVHGTLHLLGETHDTPATAAVMEGREAAILGALGYPDPYVVMDG